MEFWGVEVKSGESLKVDPGDDKIVHLSMACLGEVNVREPVSLYVKFDNQKLAIGTLSSHQFPQISYDLIFEKEFELSHNWKNGSVFFTGYKAESQLESDNDEDSDDFDGEDFPLSAANGRPEFELKNGVKPDANEAKQKEKIADPRKNEKANEKDANDDDEEEDSSRSESDEDSSEDEPMANGEQESSEDEDDSDNDEESDDEETPKKAEVSNKRVLDSSKKTPVPVKKAKFVTPQKTDGKNGGHVATPHPSKQAGKATANNREPVKLQTPKSVGDYSCKPCNRSFKTEDALNSHNRAKHTAAK
ncbi:histone deacetylase HDT1 isoform X1 [Gastrolobium bilobum]|uniref:histone deacetylase HDT1 isoform X1 n=1 Tax=Gastrolobium bilobum TaxID=150636 RepID=UPI002AB28E28|nr:histone deacetylase HDT1 isoform X1 [Gastrolobium bilobum]